MLYLLAHTVIIFIQALPLKLVAWLGRRIGFIFWCLDARHRRVALPNLTLCLGNEKSPAEIRALARENFRRIGENFACAVKTAAMDFESLRSRVEFAAPALSNPPSAPPRSVVCAIGRQGCRAKASAAASAGHEPARSRLAAFGKDAADRFIAVRSDWFS